MFFLLIFTLSQLNLLSNPTEESREKAEISRFDISEVKIDFLLIPDRRKGAAIR